MDMKRISIFIKVQVNFTPGKDTKARWSLVNATPWPLYPRERPGTHFIGGWVGPKAGLGGCGKFRPPTGFGPPTVQPVASRYTDCAISANYRKLHTDYMVLK